MSGDLVPTATGELAMWTPDQVELIRRVVAPGSTDDELAFFAQVCRHRNLDPFAGQIVAIQRWNAAAGRKVMVVQETVAGQRAIASRTGLYAGQSAPEWCGPDGRWRDVWLDKEPPAAAKVAVYRTGFAVPVTGIARYASYVQLDKNGQPTGLWKTGPDFMLAKCAEANALRRAFPEALAGRELSAASRVSMEARDIGLDENGRHALVAEITDGRTTSTRQLTDDELLEVRSTIARLQAENPDDDPAPRTISAAGPGGRFEHVTVDPTTGEVIKPTTTRKEEPPGAGTRDEDHGEVPPSDAPPGSPADTERLDLIGRLVAQAKTLTETERCTFHAYLAQTGIGAAKKVKDFTDDELEVVAAYFDQLEEPF